MSTPRMLKRLESERGVVAIFVAFLMVVLAGSAAMTFDLARLRHERHLIQAAVDLGSLAGASQMPVSDPATAAAAEATALAIALANAPQLPAAAVDIEFACIVSDPQGDGGADSDELRYRCGPAGGSGWNDGLWQMRGGKALHPCNPYIGDRCNTVKVTASSEIGFYFAPLLGYQTGNTGAVRAASCRGCGPMPLDMVLVIDRSGSMQQTDVTNVKNAIANPDGLLNSVLEYYDPENVRIGLVALPYKNQSNCNVGTASTQYYPNTNWSLWQVTGLSRDYRLDNGTLNTTGSTLVQRVRCLLRATTQSEIVDGNESNSGHTDYGDPLRAAQSMLENDPLARDDVPNVIVFMGDGEANQPMAFNRRGDAIYGRYNPCAYADGFASAVKSDASDPTTIFALGYGVGDQSGNGQNPRCSWDVSPSLFANDWATTFYASVASSLPDETPSTDDGIPSGDNWPGGCDPAIENYDGDYYFCEESGTNLSTVFLQIAAATMQQSALVNF